MSTRPRFSSGLVNLGNSCYLASTLQCLAALPPLASFFISAHFEREESSQISTLSPLSLHPLPSLHALSPLLPLSTLSPPSPPSVHPLDPLDPSTSFLRPHLLFLFFIFANSERGERTHAAYKAHYFLDRHSHTLAPQPGRTTFHCTPYRVLHFETPRAPAARQRSADASALSMQSNRTHATRLLRFCPPHSS